MEITKVVKCLKCGSFIHETERCYNWYFWNYCNTNGKFEQNCKCNSCINKCNFCNQVGCTRHNGKRCETCNELIHNYCQWDHSRPPCQYCGLPNVNCIGACQNFHIFGNRICLKCNMPEFSRNHAHDDNVCKICDTLLNRGRCIYNCVGGGKFCIYCNYEGVVNGKCTYYNCLKGNTGQFTKCAKK